MVLLIPARVRELKGQGRAEERVRWEAWWGRCKEAGRKGEVFNEPVPSEEGGK